MGQKTIPATIDISQLVDTSSVDEIVVHVGINLMPPDDHTLMWSRAGLEMMAREKGTLYPALSLIDCANFTIQHADVLKAINKDLAVVISRQFSGKVIYLQLYNNTPCYNPPEFHAISGLQASLQCLHHQVSTLHV